MGKTSKRLFAAVMLAAGTMALPVSVFAAPIVYMGSRTITSGAGTIAATYTIDTDGTTGSSLNAITHITGYSITLNDGVSSFTFGRTSTGGDSVSGSFTATATGITIGSNDELDFNSNALTAAGSVKGLLNFGSFSLRSQIVDENHATVVTQFAFGGLGTIATAAPAAAAVPEPASWALMILGMGAVGYAMRRRVRASEIKFNAKIKRIEAGEIA